MLRSYKTLPRTRASSTASEHSLRTPRLPSALRVADLNFPVSASARIGSGGRPDGVCRTLDVVVPSLFSHHVRCVWLLYSDFLLAFLPVS